MPTNNLTHFVLVDFENVPGIDLSVLSGHPLSVTLFLGPKSKLKPVLVEQMTTLPFEVRLIKVTASRKNLLDFVLTFHLGEMVSRYPRGHYYIVSGDKKDFDPVVAHLKANHFHVSLHPNIAALPFLVQSKPAEQPEALSVKKPAPAAKAASPAGSGKPPPDRRTKIMASLKDPMRKNRPTTLKGLQAHIKNAFGTESTAAKVEEVIRDLHSFGLTTDTKGKVSYP